MIKQSLCLYRWLLSLKLEHYFLKFEKNRYNSMPFIYSLSNSQVSQMISIIGCELQEEQLIRKSLNQQSSGIDAHSSSLDDNVIEWIMSLDLQHYAKILLDEGYLTMSSI